MSTITLDTLPNAADCTCKIANAQTGQIEWQLNSLQKFQGYGELKSTDKGADRHPKWKALQKSCAVKVGHPYVLGKICIAKGVPNILVCYEADPVFEINGNVFPAPEDGYGSSSNGSFVDRCTAAGPSTSLS